jgi:hypothetical protein
MIEEEDNIVPAAWIVKAPRLPNTKFCRNAWYAKLAHAGANRDVTDAISCHIPSPFLKVTDSVYTRLVTVTTGTPGSKEKNHV